LDFKTFKGEMALLDGSPRSADVWADEDSEFYRLTFDGYKRICIGWSHLVAGDVAEASLFFEKAVQISVDPWYSLFPKLALAYGLILNGKVNDARQHIAEIEIFCEEFGVEFAGKPARYFQGVVRVGCLAETSPGRPKRPHGRYDG
jgi:hypothetical protein